MTKINNYFLVILASIPSIIICFVFVKNSIPIVYKDFDSFRYTGQAIEILKFGFFKNLVLKTELDVLPLYPYLISFFYKLFGVNNYLPIILFQSFIVGLISLILGLIAEIFNKKWFYPSIFLCCIWPNLIWRVSYISPEVIFTFFIILSFYLVLKFFLLKKSYLVYLSFFVLGLAFITRPNAILLPFFLLIFISIFLKVRENYSNTKIIKVVLFCLISFFSIISFQFYKVYVVSGEFGYTSQSGRILMNYTYPCLAQKYGCGKRNVDALEKIQEEVYAVERDLPAKYFDNSIIISNIQKKVAIESILKLPIEHLLLSSISSITKLFYHNFYYDVLERFKISNIHISETNNIKDFFSKIMQNTYMQVWLFFQVVLIFIGRIVQIFGFLNLMKDKQYSFKLFLLIIYVFSLTIISIGNSAIRYRVFIEPFIILMTISGFFFIKNLLKKKYI